MFRNILVCVDGSPQSDRALREAIDLADCQNSRLTILTAIVRPPAWANTPMTTAGVEPLTVELEREATQALCRAVDRVPDCIPVTKILSEDPIRDALDEQLRTGRYDLVVLGTRAGVPSPPRCAAASAITRCTTVTCRSSSFAPRTRANRTPSRRIRRPPRPSDPGPGSWSAPPARRTRSGPRR